MPLEFTENKSNIGSSALKKWPDVYTILSCNRIAFADPSAIICGAIGNRSATGWRLYLERFFLLQKVCNFLEIGRQPIGDWSAISRRLKTVSGLSATAATDRRSVTDQSATSRRPVGDHQKPFYDRFGRGEVLLAATKTSLRPNRPCNLL